MPDFGNDFRGLIVKRGSPDDVLGLAGLPVALALR